MTDIIRTRRKRRIFSDADIDRLFAMRDVLKLSWVAIGHAWQDTDTNVCTRYKYYKEKRRIEALRAGEPIPPRPRRTWSAPSAPKKPAAPKVAPVAAIVKAAPPLAVHRPKYIHEADMDIIARIDRQGLTSGFLGDPPKGRSALDQRRAVPSP